MQNGVLVGQHNPVGAVDSPRERCAHGVDNLLRLHEWRAKFGNPIAGPFTDEWRVDKTWADCADADPILGEPGRE